MLRHIRAAERRGGAAGVERVLSERRGTRRAGGSGASRETGYPSSRRERRRREKGGVLLGRAALRPAQDFRELGEDCEARRVNLPGPRPSSDDEEVHQHRREGVGPQRLFDPSGEEGAITAGEGVPKQEPFDRKPGVSASLYELGAVEMQDLDARLPPERPEMRQEAPLRGNQAEMLAGSCLVGSSSRGSPVSSSGKRSPFVVLQRLHTRRWFSRWKAPQG